MNFGPASLSRRLLIGAAFFIALALVVAAIVIGFVLHRFVQGQIDQRLDTQIVFLSSMLSTNDEGVMHAVAGDADGPPFDRPARGWYWGSRRPKNILLSRSLERAPDWMSRNSIALRVRSVRHRATEPALAMRSCISGFSKGRLDEPLSPSLRQFVAPRSAVIGPLHERR